MQQTLGFVESYYIKFCKALARFSKAEVKPSRELSDALEMLEWDIRPEEIARASRVVMYPTIAIFLLLLIVSVLFGLNPIVFIVLTAAAPLAANHFLSEYPKSRAKEEVLVALGNSPLIVAQLATSLKQNPNLEQATGFVAKYGEGRIARDFSTALRDVWVGKYPSLFDRIPVLAEKYGKWSEGFHRSMYLILSSFNERNARRKAETYNKSMEVILTDFVDKIKEYTSSLHMPTLFIFGFGIIMPLILVSVFPLVSFFGGKLSLDTIAIFLLVSLVGVYFYSGIILRRRPPMLTITDIERDVPEGYLRIGKTKFPAVPFSIVIALLISAPGVLYFFATQSGVVVAPFFETIFKPINTLPIIWGVGAAVAIYYHFSYAYLKAKRDVIKKIDDDVPDALYYIRNTLAEGKPIEDAFDFVAKMRGETDIGKQFRAAARMMKRRLVSFDEVISGHDSPFSKTSKLLTSSLSLISASMRHGIKAATETCTVLIEYISKLKRVERSLITMLQRNLSMMKMTAIFFAPVVCAIVVVLFQLITKGILSATTGSVGTFGELSGIPLFGAGPIAKPSFTPEQLQLLLGLYMIGINIILIRYVAVIMYGHDKIQLGLEISRAVIVAVLVFTVTLIMMKAFMGA